MMVPSRKFSVSVLLWQWAFARAAEALDFSIAIGITSDYKA
ncbi:hypothetical protein HMPREF9370_0556 [Neisseria wadsworthii 9715]|uniref:Uncharacterized protein n=1 Tax=Neisseria wadsworthii 9715 TaxID=1030841 RepID=G4CN97_9NEIS|nr:hypothetical protein HMPREF9370_0556 [Neisseria wadsworthii 9715]